MLDALNIVSLNSYCSWGYKKISNPCQKVVEIGSAFRSIQFHKFCLFEVHLLMVSKEFCYTEYFQKIFGYNARIVKSIIL